MTDKNEEKEINNNNNNNDNNDNDNDNNNNNNNNKDNDDDQESRKKRLVKGDYIIQVHIIEGREFKGRDFGATSDPMVEVHIMGEKKTTSIMKETLNPLWDERLTFDMRNVEPEDLNQSKCRLMVYDANLIRRNVLIGSFEFDLVGIYYKKNHELFNQWVALIDVTGEHEGIQGFLKVTIVVLGPGDEQYIHSEDESLELTNLFKPLLPPSIDPDPWVLKVYIWRYQHMAIADRTSRTSDPYIRVEFGATSVKTSPFKKKLSADVSKCLSLKVMEPVLADHIKVWFKDWDLGTQDDILGMKTFSWEKAKSSGKVEGIPAHWVHLYGAPELMSGELALKMNSGIIEGCWYRGSVLLQLVGKHIEEGEEFEAKQGVTDFITDGSLEPPIETWILQVDVYQAVELWSGDKFGVEMHVRNIKYKTEFVQCEKGTAEWCEVLNLDLDAPKLDDTPNDAGTISLNLPKDPEQCPDVIFYLTRKKEGISGIGSNIGYISYRRFKWSTLVKLGYDSPPQWYEFFPSDALHKMKNDEFPGTVLLGIRCGTLLEFRNGGVNLKARPFLNIETGVQQPSIPFLEEDMGSEAMELGNSHLPTRALDTMGKLTVTVLKASDVPSVDSNGKADPYVKVSLNNQTYQTETQKETLTPEWLTNNKFVFEGANIHDDVTLELWDWNILKDRYIGRKDKILLTGLLEDMKPGSDNKLNTVKTFVLDSDKYKGAKVAVSFQWEFNPRQKLKRKINAQRVLGGLLQGDDKGGLIKSKGVQLMGRPYNKNYLMKVYIYCARDLAASDGNGLSDPYLEVSYCGVKEKTEIKEKTLNPQWMQELTLNVDVPQPAEYAPRIRCAVYDWDKIGHDDLIGIFFIPFQTIRKMEKTKNPQWFSLQDKAGNVLDSKVYLAVELIDPNIRNPTPIFSIDTTSYPFDLHFLVIGVRGLKSSLGVSKPQLISTVPIAGDMMEVATDPSSDPSAKDANWLVVKKMLLDLPRNYELAPVVSLIIRDNKFGGLLKHDIGNASLKIDQFMEKIDDEGTDWIVKDHTKKILDEHELHTELKAEDEAESREYLAEKRVKELALNKIKNMTEFRCTWLSDDSQTIYELEKKELQIFPSKQIRELRVQDEEMKEKLKRRGKKKPKIMEPESIDHILEEIEENLDLDDDRDSLFVSQNKEKKNNKRQISSDNEVELVSSISSHVGDELLEEKKYEDPELGYKRAREEQDDRLAEEEKLLHNKNQEEDNKDEDNKDNDNDKEEEEKKKKKKKKLSRKKKDDEIRKNAKKMLKEWDTKAEEFCFDIDSKVAYNPDDFEPGYLKGRRKVKSELEHVADLDLKPFEDISLWTGQKGGIRLFAQNRRQVGTLKGLCKLTDHSMNIKNPFGDGLKSLLQTRVIACRLYILNGIHLVSTDNDNSSDPYLVVKLGRDSFSTRSRYLPNTLEPKFHESFEFRTRLPGPSQVEIEVWDWDGIGDDLVGTTVIDIEDRWFSPDWRRLRVKPLEERTLWNPRSEASYGKLRLWIDLLSQDDARVTPMVDISLPPREQFEMRLIIWKAKEVVIKDTLTEQNDLRITSKLKLQDWQEQGTDVHWRAKFGKGSWNWRCVYPVELPIDVRTQLSLSLWDQDVFTASDSIGEISIALDLLLKQAYLQRIDKPRLILRKDQTKRFWLDFTHPNFTGVQAKVQISMEVMTNEEAAKYPAGIGRSDPNNNPFLPPPEGRLYFNWNPFELMRQILGNRLCFKLYCIFCIVACFAIIVFIGPQFFINLVVNAVLSVSS